ncbi:MAG: DEAD/DEAH box helicase, partial [Pelagibacterales bacterium]|nr:DEAD/DEAH box helicase [Pelagibacterales bacterium]
MSNFQKLNLNPTILSTLEKKGYSNPTPIQSEAIPHLLNKKDFLGIAQTGTGKTAAFSLPIIDLLSQDKKTVKPNQIRSLILTPTRELAIQIGENIALYSKGLGLNHCVIFGGVNEFHQIKALKNGQDIVIATPGRLLDLANQGHIRFSQVEIFVLDEADRMLDMGFIHDVKKIISKLPEERQSLLFSATMPETISSLANSILKNPIKVEITPQSTTVERINQKVYLVDKSNKPALLLDVLSKPDVVAALVFSKTKHGANKVVLHLEKYGVKVAAIHGNKSQSAREKALKSLREGKINVLIATDIAARGIDVSSISHVINYDIPNDPESYVHRIGRTARAGREGVAISFCDYSENLQLRAVEKAIRMKIPVDNSHLFHGK